MKYMTLLLTFLLPVGCTKEKDPISVPNVTVTKIVIENGQFKHANGDIFFPWGLNYTNPISVGLIEDDWFNENIWKTIKADFGEMRDLGANVVRIHLQYHQFMTDRATPRVESFSRLKELVKFAEEQKMYLDITGLSSYRQSDQPDFYTESTDEERWNTQQIFWENVAKSVGSSPAVFAFNLMNEPVVSVGCNPDPDCPWTPGEGFGGFHFVQNITRSAGNTFNSTLMKWMDEMSEAIRREDDKTLITTGHLALGNFKQFEGNLDFLSPHIYPVSGEIQKSIDKINDNQCGVPLVIEETSNLRCNIKELEEFVNAIDGKYNGLMGHYHGRTIDELSAFVLKDAIQKNFLEFFRENNPNL